MGLSDSRMRKTTAFDNQDLSLRKAFSASLGEEKLSRLLCPHLGTVLVSHASRKFSQSLSTLFPCPGLLESFLTSRSIASG